jgi:hypothetical protein
LWPHLVSLGLPDFELSWICKIWPSVAKNISGESQCSYIFPSPAHSYPSHIHTFPFSTHAVPSTTQQFPSPLYIFIFIFKEQYIYNCSLLTALFLFLSSLCPGYFVLSKLVGNCEKTDAGTDVVSMIEKNIQSGKHVQCISFIKEARDKMTFNTIP